MELSPTSSHERASARTTGVTPIANRLSQYKMTTPPWKEAFRAVPLALLRQLIISFFQRCQQRMRNRRENILDRMRGISSAQSTLRDIVSDEWRSVVQV